MTRSSTRAIPRLIATTLTAALLAVACGGSESPITPGASVPPATAAATAQQTAAVAASAAPAGRSALPMLGIIPSAPPRATPAPTPAGQTPAPAPTTPVAQVFPLYAHIDTVTASAGESKYNVDASVACVKSGLFSRGMRIVWRMQVVDTATGKELQGPDLKQALLKIPSTDDVAFRYGRHGSDDTSPWYWTAAWDVPLDYPTGTMDFKVLVTTLAGKSINVSDPLVLTMKDRGIDTRLRIVPIEGK